ncbi:MAG: hypothetical protein ACYCST_15895 [Acidimicrobiales bacterium]
MSDVQAACATLDRAALSAGRLVDATRYDPVAPRPAAWFFRSESKSVLAAYLLAASPARSPLSEAADWLADGDCGRVSTALTGLGTRDADAALCAVRRCFELDPLSRTEVLATARQALGGTRPD